jgi:mannitol-1-phosphate/altronate dehydrogenase
MDAMRLSNATLGDLDARVGRPAYDRAQVTASIAHFGVGGFHRAHQAMYLDRLMNAGHALEWGICGIGPLAFIRDRDLFGGLADDDRFTAAYTAALDALHTRGARATLQAVAAGGGTAGGPT